MNVLILRLGAFGDIVHTLPLAADLAAAGHRVGWACEDRWSCLLIGSAAVARIHPLPRAELRDRRRPWGERLTALRRFARDLRASGYDAVIDAQGLAKSAALAVVANAPQTVGHARPRARELSWLATQVQVPTTSVHVIDQQRALGGALGVAAQGPWHFPLPAWSAERRWALDWLAGQGLVRPWLLNVGAGWPTKVWPQERQIAFARLAAERRIQLVVAWGSPAERQAAEAVVAAVPGTVLAPDTAIPQLAGLLAAARVVVSGDTGPLHLALALGTPAVGLFGPVPASRNGPRGRGYRTLQAPGALWERRDVSRVDMGAISADGVWQAAESAIAERH
ncbi:MAG: glycosyltransferase family 9 protein [Planctomycetes bacterium]|nr:glycosyltransferase family 9 protein [Planctomycetota bacterium]